MAFLWILLSQKTAVATPIPFPSESHCNSGGKNSLPHQKIPCKNNSSAEKQKGTIPSSRHGISLNGPDAINAYRHSWNPLTAGPNFLPTADSLPEGEFNARFFFYGALTEAQYTNSRGITELPQGFSKSQLLALFAMFYGLEPNTEFLFFPSLLGTFSTGEGSVVYGAGMNDLTLGLNLRRPHGHGGSIPPPSTK